MEAIPLPDSTEDVVVSNGAINLAPRKSRALVEIRRVPRPAGSTVADMAGALSEEVLRRKLDNLGYELVCIGNRARSGWRRRHLLAVRCKFDRADRTVLPPDRHDQVATRAWATARTCHYAAAAAADG